MVSTKAGEKMESAPPKKRKKTPYAHLFRLSHWILAAGAIWLVLTGYGIYAVSRPSWSLLDNYPSFYPSLRAIYWHKVIGIFFAPAAIIAFIQVLPKMKGMKISNVRKLTATVLIGSVVICVLTSLGLIYVDIPSPVYHSCRFLHAVCGMLLIPISLLVHIYLALFKYFPLLVPSFAPFRQSRWLQVVWFAAGLILSWALFTRYLTYHSSLSELSALKIHQSVSEPSSMDLLPWDMAAPLSIQLVNGVGFNAGVTHAKFKALHNDTHLYMKIEWEDGVYNRIYRPWIKTESGWMHLNPGGSDERIYNEDKFALIFPISEDSDFRRYGCSVYCHNDQKNGHGRHWTFNNVMVDAWHWKSVRTDPFGHVDDKYWLGSGEISSDSEARHGDPGEGGHANNLVEGINNPVMLPTSIDSITMGALLLSKAVIYTKSSAAEFPIGSEVPGALVSEPEGDRSDIKCYSTYQDGTWILRIMRKLDTGSDYDVTFRSGGEYDFTVAAFDHNANRHSYNQQVYRLCLLP
jgi:Ni,Fe-hydrogenase I cytochrome b subunit